MRKQVHTTYNSETNKWQNKVSGAQRASNTFNNKSDAQARGRVMAKTLNTEHIVHNMDGKISLKNSYGKDPCPPKDKK